MLFGPSPYDVIIRPWTLIADLQDMQSAIKDAFLPVWFAPMMWIYFSLAILALLVSLFVKDKILNIWKVKMTLPSFLISFVGISYVIVVVVAAIFAAIKTGEYFGVKLIGESYVNLGGQYASQIVANWRPGYWIACAVGPLLLLAGLLRNRIIGSK